MANARRASKRGGSTRKGKGLGKVLPPVAPPCPMCDSKDTEICQYGYPGHDVITGDEPRWWCRKCQLGFGKLIDRLQTEADEIRHYVRGNPWVLQRRTLLADMVTAAWDANQDEFARALRQRIDWFDDGMIEAFAEFLKETRRVPPDGNCYSSDDPAALPTHGYLDGARIALEDAKKLDSEARQRVFVRIRSGEFLRPFRD